MSILTQAQILEAIPEAAIDGFRFYGLRVIPHGSPIPEVGTILPNSWHNASECDWVEEDTELDGTCCFEIPSGVDVEFALGYACAWSFDEWAGICIIGSDFKGSDGIPEEGGLLLKAPVVLASMEF